MTERLKDFNEIQYSLILELGCIALVEGREFDEAYEEKLTELRQVTDERIQFKGDI